MPTCARLMTLVVLLATPAIGAPVSAGSFSPDGKQIAIAWPGGFASVMALISTIDGSVQEVAGTQGARGPSWSPDGRYVAFVGGDGAPGSTKVLDTSNGRVRSLSGTFEPPYAWREDGRRLAGFSQNEDGGWSLVVYNLPEAGVTLRAELPPGVAPDEAAVWLPETDDVAFMGRQGSSIDVYSVEGGEHRRISSSGDVIGLSLSGDRKALVWARRSKDPRYILLSLYRYDLTARSVRRLVFPDRVAGINPSPQQAPARVSSVKLSPTGRRLAISVAFGARGAVAARAVIYSVGIAGDGSRAVRTSTRTGASGDAGMVPFWSNDGAILAIAQRDTDGSVLAVFAPDGGAGRAVARSPGRQ